MKPGYKQTEVGVIPEEWEVKRLGDCLSARPDYGINAPAVAYSDRLPVYIRITDITEDGRFSPEKLASVQYSESDDFYLSDGDIVFARTGASVGKSYRYDRRDGQLVFAGFLIRVRPDPRKLLPAFASAYLATGTYWRWVRLMSMRSGQPGINGNEYSQLPFPLPPLSEQRAIAEALGDVDVLIGGLDRLIAKKRDLKRAAMQQLLTGQTRLPGFSGEWEKVNFADIADKTVKWSIAGGPFGSNLKASDYCPEGVRILQLQNIGDGRFCDDYAIYTSEEKADELLSNNIYPGEIILSKMGDPVARACFVPVADRRYLMASDGIRLAIDPQRFDKRFVHDLINSPYFRRKAIEASTGSTRQRIGLFELKSLPFLAPPLAEQTAIAAVLSDMDAEIEALERRLAKTRALKLGMMQELLTGRTRLV